MRPSPIAPLALAGLIATAAALTGCAADDPAEIMVQTTPPGAACTLMRQDKKIGAVDPTPGMVLVDRSDADITVTCTRSGFTRSTTIAHVRDSQPSFNDLMHGRDGTIYSEWVSVTLTPLADTASRR